MRKINLIVAHGVNNEIGLNNELLWSLPEDMKRFRDITMGHTVVMGRKTFESIGTPLRGRENVIVTSQPIWAFPPDVRIAKSPETILKHHTEREIFIIGGESIYKAFLPHADRLFITVVNGEFQADSWFPMYGHLLEDFENVGNEKFSADEKNKYDMIFKVYEKRLK